MTIALDCLCRPQLQRKRFYTEFGCASSLFSLKTSRSSYCNHPTDVAMIPMFLQCVFVFCCCLLMTPGNTQNLPAKAGGAHQPANNVQQCHQQAKKMSARPALQLEQVRNINLKPYHAHVADRATKVVEWEKSSLHIKVSFQFPFNKCVAFYSKVRAELRGEGARINKRHQDTNQRERKCVLWHGSVSAKEKRVGTTGDIHSHTRRWKKNPIQFSDCCCCYCVFRLYLNLVLGNVNVTLLSNQAKLVSKTEEKAGTNSQAFDCNIFSFLSSFPYRFAYKDEYEKFKLYMTIILMFGAITCLFFLNCRYENRRAPSL